MRAFVLFRGSGSPDTARPRAVFRRKGLWERRSFDMGNARLLLTARALRDVGVGCRSERSRGILSTIASVCRGLLYIRSLGTLAENHVDRKLGARRLTGTYAISPSNTVGREVLVPSTDGHQSREDDVQVPAATRLPGAPDKIIGGGSSRPTSREYVRQELARHCAAHADYNCAWLRGGVFQNRIICLLCSAFRIGWKGLPPARRVALGSIVRCEDHREVLDTILSGSGECR